MIGLKGLTAKDRADWEKKFQEQLKGRSAEEIDNAYRNYNFKQKYGNRKDYNELLLLTGEEKEAYWNKEYDDSLANLNKLTEAFLIQENPDTTNSSDATRIDTHEIKIELGIINERDKFKEESLAYNQALLKYTNDYGKWYKSSLNALKDVKSVAELVSPYYKRYKDTEYLPFSEDDWVNIAAEYNARKDTYGEESANLFLLKKMLDTASENQSLTEKWWNGFLNVGASATAMIIDATAGIAKGNYDYFFGDYKDVEGAGTFINYLNAIMDNSVTRYADRVLKTGSLFADTQKKYEDLGISSIPITQTYDLETGATDLMGMVFNENFLPTALGLYGFTLGSMLMGGAEAKLALGIFSGVKGATLAYNMQKTGKAAMAVRNSLNWILKTENAVNKYAIPAIVGTYEGLQEGLNTKMQFLEEGRKMVAQALSDYVDKKFNELIEEKYQKMYDEAMSQQKYNIDKETGVAKGVLDSDKISKQILNQLYQEAYDSYEGKYKESLDLAEYAATLAGVNTFMLNSAINGAINQTLKASLFSPNVTGAIRQTRLGKMVTPKGNFKVSGSGANIKVDAVLPKYKLVWNMLKEPIGEGIEEYTLDLADAFSRGGAKNNLAHFIDNKYTGNGSSIVGELWVDDLGAAWNSTKEAMVSKESWRDAILGAVSSVMGGPHIAHRATAVDKNGNIIRNSKGRVQKTFFGRGLNPAGEVESNIERVARLIPWRSGAVLAIDDNKAQMAELNDAAELLTTWLRNPDNLAKYDGLVGTFNWAKELLNSAENNDEFGYRNSVTGKAINDALMLSKLEGTEYYNSFMNLVIEAANLTSDSETAKSYIQVMRDNIATKQAVEGLSDLEILLQIKDNANKMLDIQSLISESSKQLDKTFGNLDIDTKEALIFGELKIKDWQSRYSKLEEELKQVSVQNSANSTNVNRDVEQIIALEGSIKKAISNKNKLELKIKELEDNIKATKKRKAKLTDLQVIILGLLELQIKLAKAELNRYKALENLNEEEILFSESSILNMDPISRAVILDPNNKKNYSLSQLAVIENLTLQLNANNIELLNKIKDIARIQLATENYIKDYLAVITNPESFNIYTARAKAARNTEAYKKRYQTLSSILDYTEFSLQMDRLFVGGTYEERNTILRLFEKDQKKADAIGAETNYSRYIAQRQKISDILRNATHNPIMDNLSKDDIDMFVHATTYLTLNNVDLEDSLGVVNTLSALDSEGRNLFQQYVERVNEDLDEASKTNFTSVGETILAINEIMSKYLHDVVETNANEAPVIIAPTTEENNTPTVAPTPIQSKAPGVFATAAKTAEENDAQMAKSLDAIIPTADTTPTLIIPTGNNGSSITVDGLTAPSRQLPNDLTSLATDSRLQQKETDKDSDKSELIKTYERNSTPEVARYALAAHNMASSDKLAQLVIENLGNNTFSTIEEFTLAIDVEANTLDTKSDDKDALNTAELLRNISSKVKATYEVQKAKEQRTKLLQLALQEALQRAADRSPLLSRFMLNPSRANTLADGLNTLDILWLKNTFSVNPTDANYSPLLAYIERYHIEQYLASDLVTRQTPIFFITDPLLTKEISDLYAKGNYTFKQKNIPVIAVVKDKNGPILINLESYLPIGLMPSTDAKNISGSSRLDIIRNKINITATIPELILDNGKPIETSLKEPIHAEPIGLRAKGNNATIQEAGFETLTILEKQELGVLSKSQRRGNPIYKRLKKKFLDTIIVADKTSKAGKTHKLLIYDIPTLKGDPIPADVFVREVHLTKDANSDSTIEELLVDNNISVLNANSRIRGYFRKLLEVLNTFDDNVVSFEGGVPSQGTVLEIDKLLTNILESLNLFIKVRGYNYQLTPTERVTADKKVIMLLSMTDGTNTIVLGDIHKGTMTDTEKLSILKNLIMDGNKVRMQDSFHSVAQWNVNYSNFNTARLEETDDNKRQVNAAKTDVSNIYDDDILDMAKPTLSYRVSTITLNSPYTKEGELKEFPKATANSDNATLTTPLNDTPLADNLAKITNGSIVDADTGNIILGEDTTPKSQALEVSERLHKLIEEDSTNFELSEDGTHYINKVTGRKYARVTSMIQADTEGERFDSNSPWVTPSTNIGTGIDEFVRDFFADRFTYNEQSRTWEIEGKALDEVYPNATAKALSNFADSLLAFRNKLNGDGITIIPREVIALGTLKVTDNEGKVHSIDVAGTLDLLGYDKYGNWYIYDMKTKHSISTENGVTIIDDKTKAKWARLLSLYKRFLENTYGIKITELSIIPIKVEYPHPSTTEFTVRDSKPDKYNGKTDNQLIINKNQEYKGASPRLLPSITIEEIPLNLLYDKMTEADKQAEQEIQNLVTELLLNQALVVDQDSSNPPVQGTALIIEVDNTDAVPIIDPTSNMAGISDDISEQFNSRRARKSPSRKRMSKNYISPSQRWGVFEGRNINVEETIKNLEAKGITLEKWENMKEEDREKELECTSV